MLLEINDRRKNVELVKSIIPGRFLGLNGRYVICGRILHSTAREEALFVDYGFLNLFPSVCRAELS